MRYSKEEIINEIKRIAEQLNVSSLTINDFKKHSTIASTTVSYKFGSWNEAIIVAGLIPQNPGDNLIYKTSIEQDDLLLDLIRLYKEFNKIPTQHMVNAYGKYSIKPYVKNWKNIKIAFEEALKKFPDYKSDIIFTSNEAIPQNSIDNLNKKDNQSSNNFEKGIQKFPKNSPNILKSIKESSDKLDNFSHPISETNSKFNDIPVFNIIALKQEVLKLSEKINMTKEQIYNEEATKTAFILPFINLLEFDVFNPTEVKPELTADIGIKKGEKVDYGIFNNEKLIMIFECKHWEENLNVHKSQLHRYFHVTPTRIAILTNGIYYKFFTDIEEPNKMDFEPFLEFNILNITEEELKRISLLKKSNFNLEQILSNAKLYKAIKENEYKEQIFNILLKNHQEPSQDFVKYFVNQLCNKENINNRTIEYFSKVVKNALEKFKRE